MKLEQKPVLNPKWTEMVNKPLDQLFEVIKEDLIYKDVFKLLQVWFFFSKLPIFRKMMKIVRGYGKCL